MSDLTVPLLAAEGSGLSGPSSPHDTMAYNMHKHRRSRSGSSLLGSTEGAGSGSGSGLPLLLTGEGEVDEEEWGRMWGGGGN